MMMMQGFQQQLRGRTVQTSDRG